jgi:hypothetical protein
MKTIICAALFLMLAAPSSYAASCADTQNAATAAIKARNESAGGAINITMPDPEDTRGLFSDCLGSINAIGNIFNLGVSFPSMEQVIGGMCNQVDSMIQDKMYEVLSEVRSKVNEIGDNNPFQVSGSGISIGKNITGILQ